MACNCNTASKSCDPCAFCTPPGVTGLTTCKPIDICPERPDITCVEYSGVDFPCIDVANGDDLLSVLLSILESLSPGCIPTTTTSTSTTTSTTTTTTCPCYSYRFVGVKSEQPTTFTFVECGKKPPTTLIADTFPVIYCLDDAYPILQVGEGSYEKLTCCEPTTTTTTTAGPACSFYQVTNANQLGDSIIEYVPCNTDVAVQLTISVDPQLICVNNLYPITTILGSVDLIDYGPCNDPAPTTTTTTTAAPPCACSNWIVENYSGYPITITYTQCTETGNQLVDTTFADGTTTEVCACDDIYMSHPPYGVYILGTEVPCIIPTTTTTLAPPLPCKCYTVENLETVDGFAPYRIDYFDCDHVFTSLLVPKQTSVSVCALENSIVPNFTNNITDNGLCDPNCTIDCTLSGGTVSYPEVFRMIATDVTDVHFRSSLLASLPVYVNWGDGTIDFFPTGIIPDSFHHIYSYPYSGPIDVISIDLSSISIFYDVSYLGPSITTTTVELGKLDGLQITDFVELIVTGDVKDLPLSLTTFVCWGKGQSSPITGDVADLPPNLIWTNIIGQNTLYGDVADFPRAAASGSYLFNVWGLNTISGNIIDLPTTGFTDCRVSVDGFNTITGDLADVPSNYTSLGFGGNNTIYGDIIDLPSGLTSIGISGLNTISGDVINFPSGLTYIIIYGNNTLTGLIDSIACPNLVDLDIAGNNGISGDISNLNLDSNFNSLTYFLVHGNNLITGDIAGIPNNVGTIDIRGNNTIYGLLSAITSKTNLIYLSITGSNGIDGDIGDLPSSIKYLNIAGANTINAYTQPHTWFSPMNSVLILGTVALSSTIIDNLLIDLDNAGMVSGSHIELKGTYTVASLAARTALAASGVVIIINP